MDPEFSLGKRHRHFRDREVPLLASAGKSITCVQNLGGYSCLARGLNNGSVYNGVVAEVVVSISTASDTVTIGLGNALGASPSAVAIPVTATGGSISVIPPPTNLTISGQVTASDMGLSSVTINVNGSADHLDDDGRIQGTIASPWA